MQAQERKVCSTLNVKDRVPLGVDDCEDSLIGNDQGSHTAISGGGEPFLCFDVDGDPGLEVDGVLLMSGSVLLEEHQNQVF